MEGRKLISLLKFYKKQDVEIEVGINLKGGLFIRGKIIKLRRFFGSYLVLQDKENASIKVFLEDVMPYTIIPVNFLKDNEKKEKNKINKTSRSPISPKLRFEVFKRDKFVCQYCGACGPDVEFVKRRNRRYV